MDALTKTFPPYAGDEPYIHLCFSEASAGKVLALLRRLRMRGVRVWYCPGNTADRREREETQRRMLGAGLTLLYLDENLRNDPAAKSRLLTCQGSGQPVICLNTDGGDSGLSLGLHADAFEVKLGRGGAEEAENALLHAEGFSQEFIGEPDKGGKTRFGALIKVLAALTAALILAGAVLYFLHRPEPGSDISGQTDSVEFADRTIRRAVRDALGGEAVTEESLAGITALRLPGDSLPRDLSDLALLPSLETLELTQSAASGVPEHPELFAYTIELYGGAAG